MKKQLLAIALIGSGLMNAQVFTQNFESPTPPALPAGWMQNNVDGFTVHSSLNALNFGSNAWVTYNLQDGIYNKVGVSTSYYTSPNTANDWLITPNFTVPTNTYLEWDAVVGNSSFPDGYQVLLSNTGTLVANFTNTLFTIAAENSSWTHRVVDLSAFAGQSVHVAYRNNSNDMVVLFLDNVKVIVPPSSDGSVIGINNLTRYMSGAGTQTISGTFKNLGAITATNAVLNYKVNNGAVVTQTMTFAPTLTYNANSAYTFSTPANIPLGANKVKVWVTSVNGTAETNLVNDTTSATIYVASQTTLRNALIEEFTSSTCGPCASLNQTFDPLLNSNNPNTGGRVNLIKNQVNWPSPGNDPSYNSHSAARVTFYDITGAPTAITNGITEMNNHNQAEIDVAKNAPAFANITASLSLSGGVLSGSADITPFVGIPSASPLRIHQVILQDFYNYPGASTSQKNYYHIMRKMLPDANGTAFTPVDGTVQTVNFTHNVTSAATPAQGSFDFWSGTFIKYEYVVFVQDQISNDVLQSGSAFYQTPNGIVTFEKDNKIGVYPNPAKDYALVGILLDAPSSVDITIMDITGKVVYNNKGAQVDMGSSEIKINTSEFASGTYNILVNTKEGLLKEKLVIVK
ncbi:MAG: choice-of-anchor J domain-containing protein [Sphingobacteriaceae bacterium]|nr:choice-of-anchor J domain-containing protein [Sphingobacteriaceae bacterium]